MALDAPPENGASPSLRGAGIRTLPHWEAYVTDPRSEPDPSKRVTDIYLPLR
jgi:hypothetical protein